MLMKKFIIIFLAFVVMSVYADTALCLHKHDGAILKIQLSSQPNISYNVDSVFIKTKYETISYLVSDFKKITFEEVSDESITTFIPEQIQQSQEKCIYFDLSGNQMLNLSNAKNGIYILKTPTSTIKIFKHK